MWVQTARRVNSDGDMFTVYRDREANQCVFHNVARRGGCLYIGSVTLVDQATAASYAFSTTSPDWADDGPRIAQAYWARHAAKLS